MERTFINIGYITKTNINNLNSSENSGNLVVAKKIIDFKGNAYIYVSGQAMRYYIKETLNELGENITPVDEKGEYNIESTNKGEERYKDIVKGYIDLDLFGFMEATKGSKSGALRRWSPVKVSPMISIYPWKGEVDLLTRKKKDVEGGDLVKVQINTFNFMRGTIMMDVGAIGSYVEEITLIQTGIKEIFDLKKKERLNLLIESLKCLDGGAKRSRLLDDLTPKFVIISKQKTGAPVFLNSLNVDKEGAINVDLIREAIEEYKLDKYVIGIRSGIFSNKEKIEEAFGTKVMKVNKAFDEVKTWLGIKTDDGKNQSTPV